MSTKPNMMKKPIRKAKQLQSGNGKKPKPKFYEVHDECVATRKKRIRQLRKQLVDCGGDDPTINGFIEKAENELERIEAYRQRYERYQANKKVPRKLRDEIASAETDLLQEKFDYHPTALDCALGLTPLSHIPNRTGRLYELFAKVDRIKNPVRTENGSFKVGQCYDISRIKKAYDTCACEVLQDHLDNASKHLTKKIVSPLPRKAEYLELKDRFYTRTLADLTDEAYYGLHNHRRDVESERISWEENDECEEWDRPEAEYEQFSQFEEDIDCIIDDQPVLPACVSQLPVVFHRDTDETVTLSSLDDEMFQVPIVVPIEFLMSPDLEIGMLRAVAEAIQSYRGRGPELTEAEAKALDECYERLRDHADKISNSPCSRLLRGW